MLVVMRLLFLLLVFALPSLASVTFTKDVAPIFYKHCVSCHRPNDIAPMSLLTYKLARPWAQAVKEAVLTRKMPPWHADPKYGTFANDARLSDDEIGKIKEWADSGAAEGDPKDMPAAPVSSDEWRLGKPDVIFQIPEDHVVKGGVADQTVTIKV